MTDDLAAWERAAAAYDRFEQGDVTRRTVLEPALFDLLGDVRGRRVLDLGAGNGHIAARLAEAGADVVALEGAPTLVAIAKERHPALDIRVADLRAPFKADGMFDIAVAHMLVTSLVDLAPLCASVRRHLRPEGRFIVSCIHPAFTSPVLKVRRGVLGRLLPRRNHRLETVAYPTRLERTRPLAGREDIIVTYHHRNLETLVREIAAAGFAVSAVREPLAAPGLTLPAKTRHAARVPLYLLLEARAV